MNPNLFAVRSQTPASPVEEANWLVGRQRGRLERIDPKNYKPGDWGGTDRPWRIL